MTPVTILERAALAGATAAADAQQPVCAHHTIGDTIFVHPLGAAIVLVLLWLTACATAMVVSDTWSRR